MSIFITASRPALRALFISLCLVGLTPDGFGQEASLFVTDKQENLVQQLKRVDSLSGIDQAAALALARDGLEMAQELGLPQFQGDFLERRAMIFHQSGRLLRAEDAFEQAYGIWQRQEDSVRQMQALQQLAFSYFYQDKLEQALQTYNRIIEYWKVFESREGSDKEDIIECVVKCNMDLFELYSRQKDNTDLVDPQQAQAYYQEAMRLMSLLPQEKANPLRLRLLLLKGRLELFLKKDYEAAIKTFHANYQLADSLQSLPDMSRALMAEGVTYVHWGDAMKDKLQKRVLYLKALDLYLECHALLSNAGNQKNMVESYVNLGGVNRRLKEWSQAIDSLWVGIALARATEAKGNLAAMHRILYETYQDMGVLDSALHHHKRFIAIQQSVFNEKSDRIMNVAKVEFDLDRKERQNLLMQQELERERWRKQTILIVGLLLALALASGVMYFFLRNRNLIIRHEVENLTARLDGMEDRALEISRQLHDNIAGDLLASRLNLEGLETSLPDQKLDLYDTIYQGLVTVSLKVRDISKTIIADPVKKKGLIISLEEFFQNLDSQGSMGIHFKVEEETPLQITPRDQDDVYHIVRELLTNVKKYAKASRVDIHIYSKTDRVEVRVKDNGLGFVYNPDDPNRGMGLDNAFIRAKRMQGSFELTSQPGFGTSGILSIPNQTV